MCDYNNKSNEKQVKETVHGVRISSFSATKPGEMEIQVHPSHEQKRA